MQHKSILVLIGPPGVGKGTLAAKFENCLSIKTISTGQLFRENVERKTELGLKVAGLIDRGELVCDELVNEIFRSWFDSNWHASECGILLDGYPRSLNQAEFFINFISEKKLLQSVIVCLVEADDKVILDRIVGRLVCSKPGCGAIYSVNSGQLNVKNICLKCGSALVKRKDDDLSCAKVRLTEYRQYKNALIEHFQKHDEIKIVSVDTEDKDPEAVFEAFRLLLM